MKKRRGYFKHYNDAYSGSSITNAMADREYVCVHLFWAILERANQLSSQNFTEPCSYFARVLRITCSKVERELIKTCSYFDQISIEIHSKNVSISIGNYLEYQETRGGKRWSKQDSKEFPLKIKDKRLKIKDKRLKIKDEEEGEIVLGEPKSDPPHQKSKGVLKLCSAAELIEQIGPEKISQWIELYPDADWVNHEIKKSYQYFVDAGKSSKTLKGWIQTINRWLSRGWDWKDRGAATKAFKSKVERETDKVKQFIDEINRGEF